MTYLNKISDCDVKTIKIKHRKHLEYEEPSSFIKTHTLYEAAEYIIFFHWSFSAYRQLKTV